MKRRNLILSGIGVLALALGLLAIRGGDLGPDAMSQADRGGERAARPGAGDPRSPHPAQRGHTTPIAIARLVAEAQQEDEGRIPSTLAEITQAVVAEDAALAEFHKIRGKALRTRAEQQRYREMLADVAMIQSAKEDLLAAAESEEALDQEEEVRRLLELKYLRSAMDWKENPHREEVLAAVSDVLFVDPPAGPRERRGSVLGDKVDLYQHVMASDPEMAQRVRREAEGSPLAQVFMHAERMLSDPEGAAQELP